MSRYHCTNCEHDFDHDDESTLRCPECLRQNGIEPVTPRKPQRKREPKRDARRSRRLLLSVIISSVVLAAGASALLLWRGQRAVPRPGQLGVLGPDLLRRTLVARGVPDNQTLDPFAAGEALAQLAGKPSGAPAERARAVAKTLAAKLAPLRVDLSGRGTDDVRNAAELAADLAEGRAKSALTFELAALLATALRHVGLPALICEVFTVDAPTASADVTGIVGRYVVAVYPAEKLGGEPLIVLDPARAARLPAWAGGHEPKMTSKAKQLVPLDDGSAAARMLSLKALREIQRGAGGADRAYELSALALKAGTKSATMQLARATVVAQAGGVQDGVDGARTALSLRDDAPRHAALAQLLLAKREVDKAEDELKKALTQDPGHWLAHQTLAAVRLMRRDAEGARKHLEAAEKLAPEEPTVIALRAMQLLSDGEERRGLALLRKAAAREPSEQILLQLYMALLDAGQAGEAKKVKKKLLSVARDRKRLKAALARLTGEEPSSAPTSAPAAPPAAGAGADLPPPGGKIELPDIKLAPGGIKRPQLGDDLKLTPPPAPPGP